MKKSYRLGSWDYSGRSSYFITVCTKDRHHHFGEIENGEMIPTPLGEEVIRQWLQTPVIRPYLNISLDEFTLMPNHFHGIISIGRNLINRPIGYSIESTGIGVARRGDPADGESFLGMDASHPEKIISPRGCDASHPPPLPGFPGEEPRLRPLYKLTPTHYGPQSNNLGSVMRGFKSSVTMFARQHKILFDWQLSYHDIIIRDERAWKNIRRYIRNNVKNWRSDRLKKK
jgi:REP element-mobilizing transposase RayT